MMDNEAQAERLRRLQAIEMADLGTARREYISTVDNKYKHVTMDRINAAREINKKGTTGQRLAEAHKEELNAWNHAWKVVAGDVEMESLDSLMDGQSHRARLVKEIREDDGQKYANVVADDSVTRRSTKVKAANKAVKRPAAPPATHGRNSGKPSTPKSALKRPELDRTEKPLDPARECNNRSPPSGGISKKKGPVFGGRRPPRPPTMKTRRAVQLPSAESWESKLADSGTFMEAIRIAFPPKSSSQQSVLNSKTAVNETRDRTESSTPVVETKPEAGNNFFAKSDGSGERDLGAKPGAMDTISINSKESAKPKATSPCVTPPDTKIQAFCTPSPNDGKPAASGTTKPRLGFYSSLPQPTAPWLTSNPEENPTAMASGPSIQGAKANSQTKPKTIAPQGTASGASIQDAKSNSRTKPETIAPQGTSTPVRKPASVAATNKNDKDQAQPSNMPSSELHDELDKLTKLLAETSMLPAAAVAYLKERKEGLESELYKARGAVKLEATPFSKLPKEYDDPFRSSTRPKGPSLKKQHSTGEHDPFGPSTTKPDASFPPKQQPSATEDNSSGPSTKTKGTHSFGEQASVSGYGLFGSSTKPAASFPPKPQPTAKKSYSFDPPTKFSASEHGGSIIGERWLPGRWVAEETQPSSGQDDNLKKKVHFKLSEEPPVSQASSSQQPQRKLPANLPINAATMQYFKESIGPVEEKPSATENTTSAPSTVNTVGAPNKPQSISADVKKSFPQTTKDNVGGLQANLRDKGLNLPISAATLQYGKDLFPPESKPKDNRSKGHDTASVQTQPKQRPGLSADASSFKPIQHQKENGKRPNTTPSGSSLFQSRMEKQGVSVKGGNGLYASKYAS